eukprot:TRINITY_DN7138_c0_g1_i2.p1 TRINITY_DN7138_c0_g1~~TRINITY_DN7138_c0_g1_i2.p1  ORF type:complete len:384 (+),score=83.64 TRINITY_DN7138_c0_g1_i2:73-1224(+)
MHQMFKGIGASMKRGKQQVLQKIGMSEETEKDAEYYEKKAKVQACKQLFKDMEKQIRLLDKGVQDLCGTFNSIVYTFSEFGKTIAVADIEHFSQTMNTSVQHLSQQAQIYCDTVTGNSLQIAKATHQKLEDSESSHSDIKVSKLEMDALRHEVKSLSDIIDDIKTPADRRDKTRISLQQKQMTLEKKSTSHSQLTRDAKISMALATSDATTSIWSIYTILFQQTQQHFSDLAKEMTTLTNALVRCKNSGVAKCESTQDVRFENACSAASPASGTIQPEDFFGSPAARQFNPLGDQKQAELVIKSSPVGLSFTSPFSKSSAGSNSNVAKGGLQEASVADVFGGAEAPPPQIPPSLGSPPVDGSSAWKPDWERKQSADSDSWDDF